MRFTNFNLAVAAMAISMTAGGVEGRVVGGPARGTDRRDPCAPPEPGEIVRVSGAICTEPKEETPTTATTVVGGAFGDPHFLTWSGSKFDFHGSCDLVLLHSDNFSNGSGLDIHVRTEIRDFYSFINGVAIRVGDDIFEAFSYGAYYVNGEPGDILLGVKEHEKYEQVATLFGQDDEGNAKEYAVEHTGTVNFKRHKFRLSLDEGEILIKIYEEFVAVYFTETVKEQESLADSKGLMGTFGSGALLSRDGVTDMSSNPTEFGKEWRVGNTPESEEAKKDAILFHDQSHVQQKCVMPELGNVVANQRKLRHDAGNDGEDADVYITLEDARAKCSETYPDAKDEEMRESCVYDVLATGVLELADAGVM